MRRKKIGIKNFHGSVDITDPCYSRDVWCRMNDVKIKDGDYTCMVWYQTDKGEYDGKPYAYKMVGIIGIYLNGIIPPQKSMEEIGSIGVDAGLAGFFHNKPDYSDETHGANSATGSVAATRGSLKTAFTAPPGMETVAMACMRRRLTAKSQHLKFDSYKQEAIAMTVEKQTIQIRGSVVFPLEIGRPAWISEDNGGYRRTSNVQNFEQVSPTEIRFETRNTLYVLHLLSSTSKGLGAFPA